MYKLIKYLKGYTAEAVIAPLFKFLEAAFELLVPILMTKIIDVGIVNDDKKYILAVGGIIIGLGALGLVCSLIAQYFSAKASAGFGTAVRNDFLKHVNGLSNADVDRIGTSSLITRLTSDINQTQTGVNMFLRLFLRSPFVILGAIIMSFIIDVKLAVIFVIATPIIGLIIFLIMKKTLPYYKKVQTSMDEINTDTGDNLEGVRVIRAFSRQDSEEKSFHGALDRLRSSQLKGGQISALLNPATYVVVNLAIIAILYYGGGFVNVGRIKQGEVVALISYMTQIMLSLIVLANLIVILTKASASAARINEVFKVPTVHSPVAFLEMDKDCCAVKFDKVSFAYNDGKKVLDDISFCAKRGERIGIIGGTGSGKSTLVNLIAAAYPVTEGSIKIYGKEVGNIPSEQLRSILGFVPQKAVLFSGNIRDNLNLRKKDASDEEIYQAIEASQSADTVKGKKDGLDYILEQGGKNLSGGQRQRLTIARAVLGKPDILVLDDSASALDYATEAALRKSLSEYLPFTTVFTVAQRATALTSCDKIIVLDNGRAVGIGTHKELLSNNSVYREICRSQMSEEEVSNEK